MLPLFEWPQIRAKVPIFRKYRLFIHMASWIWRPGFGDPESHWFPFVAGFAASTTPKEWESHWELHIMIWLKIQKICQTNSNYLQKSWFWLWGPPFFKDPLDVIPHLWPRCPRISTVAEPSSPWRPPKTWRVFASFLDFFLPWVGPTLSNLIVLDDFAMAQSGKS